jgi:hypothetical protein
MAAQAARGRLGWSSCRRYCRTSSSPLYEVNSWRELDAQVSLDHLSQARYAQADQGGLLPLGSDVGTSSLMIAWTSNAVRVDS